MCEENLVGEDARFLGKLVERSGVILVAKRSLDNVEYDFVVARLNDFVEVEHIVAGDVVVEEAHGVAWVSTTAILRVFYLVNDVALAEAHGVAAHFLPQFAHPVVAHVGQRIHAGEFVVAEAYGVGEVVAYCSVDFGRLGVEHSREQ